MRTGWVLIAFSLLFGCTAMVVGGSGAGGGYSADEREESVARADAAISASINGHFNADPVVSEFRIDVRTYNGTVTLDGTVANVLARDQAGRIAKDTDGVVIVNNQIVVDD